MKKLVFGCVIFLSLLMATSVWAGSFGNPCPGDGSGAGLGRASFDSGTLETDISKDATQNVTFLERINLWLRPINLRVDF